MADINKLLNKKGWTGRELGIIEITNMCHLFTERMQGNKNPEPLVTEGQFKRMLNSITDNTKGNIYNEYISIHQWLSLYYNIKDANFQQAQLQFNSISDILLQAIQSEDVFSYISRLPVIMTPHQYEAEKAKGRDLWFTDLDGQPKVDDLLALVYRAFEYYAKKLETEPTKPNPLKPIRKKYLSAPITSPIIKANFNSVTDRGYYSLEDGRRSDQMTEEEWRQIVDNPDTREDLRKQALSGDLRGPEWSDIHMEAILNTDYFQQAESLYRTGDKFEAAKELAAADKAKAPRMKFVLYDDLPEDLNKWDFLVDGLTVYEVYRNSIGGVITDTEEEYLEDMEDFLAEFADMVEAMLQDISKKGFAGKEDLSKLPHSRWRETVVLWKDLYKMDLYGIREEIDRTDILFDGNWRAISNGVAILQPATDVGRNRGIDERGYYHPPEIQQTFARTSLEAYFPDAEDYAENVDKLERGREALLDSYYFLSAYNIALDLIAAQYDIPCIKCFKTNVQGIADKIDALNDMIPVLYLRITDTDYEDESLKEKKLQVLREVFTPIDYKSIKISDEAIAQVKASLEDFGTFRDTVFDAFFVRPVNGEEVGDDE